MSARRPSPSRTPHLRCQLTRDFTADMDHLVGNEDTINLLDTTAAKADVQAVTPPSDTAVKRDAGAGIDLIGRMERSFSQDIQEGSQELKEAAEQTRNIILDLTLDGIIKWVSPSWTDVVGTHLDAVKGNPISRFIIDNPECFALATRALQSDDSKSQFVKFAIKVGPASDLTPMLDDEQKAENRLLEKDDRQTLQLDGQGIMVYDRASGGESHVGLHVGHVIEDADILSRLCGCFSLLLSPFTSPFRFLGSLWTLLVLALKSWQNTLQSLRRQVPMILRTILLLFPSCVGFARGPLFRGGLRSIPISASKSIEQRWTYRWHKRVL